MVFFGCDISFPLNEKYRKSIGVDWLRRLANAGLFVACDLAGQQKLGGADLHDETCEILVGSPAPVADCSETVFWSIIWFRVGKASASSFCIPPLNGN